MADGGKEIEHQVNVLEDIFPVLAELKSHVQRALYVKRLSEKLPGDRKGADCGISQVGVQGLRRSGPPSSPGKKGCKRIDDVYLLNLLLHHPGTIGRVRGSNGEPSL